MSFGRAHDPDAGLVSKALQRDKVAFGKLVTRYYDMVYAISYGVLHSREAALDVTQDVFLKVYNDLHKFQGRSKFKTWLYRVTVNAALDATRKIKPTRSLDATDASSEEDEKPVVITDPSTGPRDLASQRELRRLIDQAIEQLSPDHRAVLVMREWQEMSYDEIAEALEVEIGTVMSRLYYARKKLAEVLEQNQNLGKGAF